MTQLVSVDPYRPPLYRNQVKTLGPLFSMIHIKLKLLEEYLSLFLPLLSSSSHDSCTAHTPLLINDANVTTLNTLLLSQLFMVKLSCLVCRTGHNKIIILF